MSLSNYSLDKFVAPHMSKLTEVGAPAINDCTKECGHWVRNFVLNTILRVRPSQPNRQLVLHYLKKVEGAFHEYHLGRANLEKYVQNSEQAVSSYFHALRHFETTTLLAYHAYDTVRVIIDEKLFQKDDGSPLQKLNRLQNVSKHANEELKRGEVSEDLSVPIWLTNTSIECHDTTLLFSDLSELMIELAKLAETLSNPPLPYDNEKKS